MQTLRGIEIYNGKPIFYGLGEFFEKRSELKELAIQALGKFQIGPIKFNRMEVTEVRSLSETLMW